MKRPLTRVLIKVVANGFYREHTGLLLTLFIVIFINFFYTNVLNQTHLTEEQIIQNALKLAITSVSEPLGVIILFSLCLLYSMKTWQYVARRINEVDVQFLFYSSTALSRARQIQSWSVVQLIMTIPILAFGLFAMIIGFAFGYWLIPVVIPVYLLALIVYSASRYTRLMNETVSEPTAEVNLSWLKRWPKPFFSLFLYEILLRKRVTYAITKTASAISIALIVNIFWDARADIRLVGILSLCVALAHVILIYQASEFELFYLRFARNFPCGHGQLYGQQVVLYSVLLLPEIVGFFWSGGFTRGLIGASLTLSITLVFRALLYRIGQRMDYYLRSVFGLFTVFLLATLFGLTELLIVGNILAAWGLLNRYYDRSLG